MTTALRPCTALPSPRIVVALSDALLRSELVRLLRDDGFLVTDVDTTLQAALSLADEILDDGLPRPQCIVLGADPHPRLAASLAAGLRELGWTTPFVFTLDGDGPSPFDRIAGPKQEVPFRSARRLRECVWSAVRNAERDRDATNGASAGGFSASTPRPTSPAALPA